MTVLGWRWPLAAVRSPQAKPAAPARKLPTPPVRVGLLGCGTVGTGVVRLLRANAQSIADKVGRPVEIARVLVRSPERRRDAELPEGLLTADPGAVLDASDIQVVVEVMGGVDPALGYIVRALRTGKSVVTANKDVMAEYGREVFAAAERGHADIFFEASVGGGIPIIRSLKESLAGNRIRRIAGILNGTTNFILSRMSRDGCSFEDALVEAQRLGYAEADPSSDVDGWDAARKLAILSSIAYMARLRPGDVERQGIAAVTARDIGHGERMGWALKLLAISEVDGGRVSMRVHPTFVPRQHPLAHVNDAFNAIYVQGDAIGEAMFYGRGAGSLPTASAVVGDLIDAARFIDRGGKGLTCTCFYRVKRLPPGLVASRFYVRLMAADRPGVLAQIAGALGRCGVNIESVVQTPAAAYQPEEPSDELERAELVLVTHRVAEGRMRRSLELLRRLQAVSRVAAAIRIAPEDL
jgi:homoserine dehydrogenase